MGQLPAVLVDGILYASWLFIIAVGLTLIYGVMKILNVAHGSLYALGAYAASTLAGSITGLMKDSGSRPPAGHSEPRRSRQPCPPRDPGRRD